MVIGGLQSGDANLSWRHPLATVELTRYHLGMSLVLRQGCFQESTYLRITYTTYDADPHPLPRLSTPNRPDNFCIAPPLQYTYETQNNRAVSISRAVVWTSA